EGDTIVKVPNSGSVVTYGTGVAGYSGDGASATLAKMENPELIDVLPDNSLIFEQAVTDVDSRLEGRVSALRRITSAGTISTISGRGLIDPSSFYGSSLHGVAGDDSLIVSGGVRAVGSIEETLVAEGWAYSSSTRNPSGAVEMYTSYGTGVGYTVARRVVTSAGVVTDTFGGGVPIDPDVIGYDQAGNSYFVPRGECRIMKRTVAGTQTTLLGSQVCDENSIIGAWGSLAVRPDGVVYWAESSSRLIRKITGVGQSTVIAQAPVDCAGSEDEPVMEGGAFEICFVVDELAVDRAGNLIVADAQTTTVLRLDTSGEFAPLELEGGGTVFAYGGEKLFFAPDQTTLYVGRPNEIVKIADVGATTPPAPSGLTVSAGDGSARVAWVAPSSNGGAPITGYAVTGGPGCTTTGATSCIVSGLSNGTTYNFTVTAVNVIGGGTASGAVSSRPLAT
ncbi:MAG: hypothetical protein EBY80_15675, partial [Actinobacteria bacterium]|nr:hypothetical protein [Actinomycetota bacterium]